MFFYEQILWQNILFHPLLSTIMMRGLKKRQKIHPNGSISPQSCNVYLPGSCSDSDLITLFPVESHVERSEQGFLTGPQLFLVSGGQVVKIKDI